MLQTQEAFHLCAHACSSLVSLVRVSLSSVIRLVPFFFLCPFLFQFLSFSVLSLSSVVTQLPTPTLSPLVSPSVSAPRSWLCSSVKRSSKNGGTLT